MQDAIVNVVLGAAIGGLSTYLFSTIQYGNRIAELSARMARVESTLATITTVTLREN